MMAKVQSPARPWFRAACGFLPGVVLLVFSYLIVPAVVASVLVSGLGARLAVGWLTATLGGVGGLYASFRWDLPTGAAIVCALGGTLVLGLLAAGVRRWAQPGGTGGVRP